MCKTKAKVRKIPTILHSRLPLQAVLEYLKYLLNPTNILNVSEENPCTLNSATRPLKCKYCKNQCILIPFFH